MSSVAGSSYEGGCFHLDCILEKQTSCANSLETRVHKRGNEILGACSEGNKRAKRDGPFTLSIAFQKLQPQWFDVFQKQLIKIEELLKKSPAQSFSIRQKCRSIFEAEGTYEYKAAEFGALIYLLDSSAAIDLKTTPSCSDYVADQFYQQWCDLKADHKELFLIPSESKKVPSGADFMVKKNFAELLFLSDSEFNVGGVYALLRFLNNSYLRFCFKQEHQNQIVMVLSCFIKNPDFASSFCQDAAIHPEMEAFIRYHLLLPENAAVTRRDLFRDLMLFLFTEVKQQSTEGNCYAVAPLLMLKCMDPDFLVERLLKVYASGSITLPGGINISVQMMLKEELSRVNCQLKQNYSVKDIIELPVVKMIKQNASDPSLAGQQQLEDVLTTHDERMAYSAQQNHWMQRLLILYFQLIGGERYSFLNNMANKLLERVPAISVHLPLILETFCRFFYLQKSSSEEKHLSQQLVRIANGEYERISTLTELQQAVVQLVEPLISEQELRGSVFSYLNSGQALDDFAQLVSEQLSHKDVTIDSVKEKNLLLFKEIGGYLPLILDGLNRDVEFEVITFDESIKRPKFLIERLHELSNDNAALFVLEDYQLQHAWTMMVDPSILKNVSLNSDEMSAQAGRRLSQLAPLDDLQDLLSHYKSLKMDADDLKGKKNLTYEEVIGSLIKKMVGGERTKEEWVLLKNVINMFVNLIRVEDISFHQLLKGLCLNSESVHTRLRLEKRMRERSGQENLFPHQMAHYFRKAIIEVGVREIPLQEIERVIRVVVGLPAVVYLGSSNWTFRFNPTSFALGYDYDSDSIKLFALNKTGMHTRKMFDELVVRYHT